jgi:hypothetical protein
MRLATAKIREGPYGTIKFERGNLRDHGSNKREKGGPIGLNKAEGDFSMGYDRTQICLGRGNNE